MRDLFAFDALALLDGTTLAMHGLTGSTASLLQEELT
jgi:hypothetical protein